MTRWYYARSAFSSLKAQVREKAMKELVEALKTERLKKGLTLHQISERAQINLSILKALEHGQFERVGPSKVIQGLLMEYCTVLGIDEDLLRNDHGAHKLPENEREPSQRPASSVADSKKARKRIVLGLSLGIMAVGIAVCILWLVGERRLHSDSGTITPRLNTHESSLTSSDEKSVQSKEDEELLQPLDTQQESSLAEQVSKLRVPDPTEASELHEISASLSPSSDKILPDAIPSSPARGDTDASTTALKNESSHHLELQADQKSWIQVTVDGKDTESYLLQPGEKREWRARDSMNVILGNGGGVRIKWDGNPVEIFGKPNRAIRFSLPDAIRSRK